MSSNSQSIVLAAGWRTPFCRAGGAFAREDAEHFAAFIARETIARSGIDPGGIDEVIAGCAGPPHDEANVGRVLALRLSPKNGSDHAAFEKHLKTSMIEAVEISPSRVEYHTTSEMNAFTGMESEMKEKRFVDLRPK